MKFGPESYADDILVGENTREQAESLSSHATWLAKVMSAVFNFQKCKGPSQKLLILGIQNDSDTKRYNLQREKKKNIYQK